jgi:nicotinate-nucleotide adenylyltransferase
MRTALYGGSFDPVTLGHMAIVRSLLERFSRVVILPADSHFHGKELTPIEVRIALLTIAIRATFPHNAHRIIISDFETKVTGNGSTFDLLTQYTEAHPNQDISFVMGTDQANNIDSWYNWEKLLAQFCFGVCERDSDPIKPDGWYTHEPHTVLPPINVGGSSSAIRTAIKNGDWSDVAHLTPLDVCQYMRNHGLYT